MEVFLDKLGLYKQVKESPGPPQPLLLEGVDLLGRGRLKIVFISYFFSFVFGLVICCNNPSNTQCEIYWNVTFTLLLLALNLVKDILNDNGEYCFFVI